MLSLPSFPQPAHFIAAHLQQWKQVPHLAQPD
jgi:hypothetical protein